MPVGDKPALAIQVGEHRLDHLGALGDAGSDRLPFGLGDQQRDGGERPGALLTFAGDAEARADILGLAMRAFARGLEIVAGQRRQLFEHRRPGRITRSAGAEHIVHTTRGAIIRDPPVGDRSCVEQRCGAARQASSPKTRGD
jgi:hypothetical protein